uniref:Metalloendopeptidase n=1 Tax=Arion vulgaris TaxID=1028688 RepID=A0A0B6ZGJ8_9EUPU
MELVYTIMCILPLLLTTLAQSGSKPLPLPSTLGRPREKVSNQTMDEIITGTLGGVDVASNMILADDRHILAELDMYLTNEQFIGMYQRPSQDDMNQMNSTVGVPKIYNYLHDSTEEDYKGSGIRTKRKAVREYRLRWTNAEIPYLFARGHFTVNEEYMMRRSMTEWERYTCLKFRPANLQDKNSVRFQNGVGCNSQLGMVGGVQVLNLQAPGCRYKGLYLHEIGHAVGLVHEHQLPDRDRYIQVLYENVNPIMRVWFNKYTDKEVNQMDVPYEYSSVMHYGITAFAADGKSQTIRAHDQSKESTIGLVYLKELAYTDVNIVNLMYNCSNHCPNKNKCEPEGHLDQNCKCICRDGSSDCDRTKRRNDDNCINNYDSWSCYIWANQGECERNPHYMKQECAKACGTCGSDVLSQGECKDVYAKSKCEMWKERGDCTTNQRWMQLSCKATCNLCGDISIRPQVACKNLNNDGVKCDNWAKDGECSVNAQGMFTNCRQSCGLCDVEGVEIEIDNGQVDEDNLDCKNTNPTCEKWAVGGECETNPQYMIANCRKACNKCDDGNCKNFYDDVQCQIWAQKLECLTNGDWMGKHCAKACGRGLCEGVNPTKEIQTRRTTTSGIVRRSTTATTVKRSTTNASVKRTTTGASVKRSTMSIVTNGPCRNLHSSDTECDIWARTDHCNINPQWMLKNCAMACKACKGDGKVATTTPTPSGSSCNDMDANCVVWAKSGYCDTNPSYNLVSCKKSCKNCNGCRDTNALCGIWAKNDQCTQNARYMLRHCQKSCKTCSKSNDDARPPTQVSLVSQSAQENGSSNHLMATQVFMTLLLCNMLAIFCRKFYFC